MNLPLRLKIIAENKKFIENRMTKGDYSVAYSVYLDMHRDVFAKYLTLQDLRYTDRKDDLSSEVTDTDKKTWAETAEQIAALQTAGPFDLSVRLPQSLRDLWCHRPDEPRVHSPVP